MAEFDIMELIEQVVEKITGDENTIENFKKDPIAAVKKIIGNIDLDNELLDKIVEAVKGKINLDEIKDKAEGIFDFAKGLFGK